MNEIEKLIRSKCPNFRVDSIENLGEGDFCRAFLVNKNTVFRFSKHDAARCSLMRENCLLPKIADQITLEIPRPENSSFGGAADSFVAYRFLPAGALTREEYLRLEEKSRTRCAAQVAEFLNELHSIEIKTAEECGILPVDYFEKYSKLLSQLRKKLVGKLDKNDFALAESVIENFLASADAKSLPSVLLHGDLSPDHVLFNGEKVTAIIDFGDAMIGDPAWDFLWIYEDYGADFFSRAIENYKTEDKKGFVERVCRFSNLEAVSWILECAENGDDFSEPLEHLKKL